MDGATAVLKFRIPCTWIASLAVTGLLVSTPAMAKTARVTANTPACTSWAGWHDWLLASLTPKGASLNRSCPSYISKGTRVEVIEDDDGEGAATIRWKDKTWFTHADRLGE